MSPVVIPENIPASKQLKQENIFVMNTTRAMGQDIRPLQVLIVNIMPTKIDTETQLLRLLGNTIIQIETTLLCMSTYESKNTPRSHLEAFYKTFDEILDRRFDAMIVTGAPVEELPFEEVSYWAELSKILNWAKTHVFASLFICWGAQAALFHYYQIGKIRLDKKLFGVFPHKVLDRSARLTRGFDDIFYVPHSRHTAVDEEMIRDSKDLDVVVTSPEAGAHLIVSKDRRQVFVTGHPEYDIDTLKTEYLRDLERGLSIQVPVNYFVNDDPREEILVTWRSHANLFYGNWINYYVYQETDYQL